VSKLHQLIDQPGDNALCAARGASCAIRIGFLPFAASGGGFVLKTPCCASADWLVATIIVRGSPWSDA
jgi:hypothetical protein